MHSRQATSIITVAC